jgi:hypothetical protein
MQYFTLHKNGRGGNKARVTSPGSGSRLRKFMIEKISIKSCRKIHPAPALP